MAGYGFVPEMWEEIDGFEGAVVLTPKFQCSKCGSAISERWAEITGKCGRCQSEESPFRNSVTQISTASIYFESSWRHDFSKEVVDAKNGAHVGKMAGILAWLIEGDPVLSESTLLCHPPSRGDDDENHMEPIVTRLSEEVGIEYKDALTKIEDYPPQTEMGSFEERFENIWEKMGADEGLEDHPRAIVVDNVVTSGATMAESGRALSQAGVTEVYGAALASYEAVDHLCDIGALEEKDGD